MTGRNSIRSIRSDRLNDWTIERNSFLDRAVDLRVLGGNEFRSIVRTIWTNNDLNEFRSFQIHYSFERIERITMNEYRQSLFVQTNRTMNEFENPDVAERISLIVIRSNELNE